MKKQWKFKWTPKLVKVANIKPTPKNFKIKNDLGLKRLQTLLADFGLAGTVVVNTDMTLIDGNSRLQEAKDNGEKEIWVSIPNKKLNPKEFKTMSAMFDMAKAGDVDTESILLDLGTHQQFLDKFDMNVPVHLLEKMGKNSRVTADLKYDEKEEKKPEGQFRMVQLFLTPKQEEQFRVMEDILAAKLKTDNTTDTVFKALKKLTGK